MYKHSLDKKSTKHICPKCLKKRFVLYVKNDNGTYISDKVGRCDREINCGYHFTPSMYFQGNNVEYNPINQNQAVGKKIIPTSFHSNELLESTLNIKNCNCFIYFLDTLFEKEQVEKITGLYFLGTASFWNNATIFWQIEIALDFEEKTNSLLDHLKNYKKFCPPSKKKKLRKCVIHKNTSLIYKINKNNIELVTFIDNHTEHNY